MIYFILVACPLVLVALIYLLGRYETESPRAAELSWAVRESKTAPPKNLHGTAATEFSTSRP